jgi:putative intracellular protease/amidase
MRRINTVLVYRATVARIYRKGNFMTSRILMIVTSNARMGDTGTPTGLWAEELAVPYYALADAGVDVTLASPAWWPRAYRPGQRQAGRPERPGGRALPG